MSIYSELKQAFPSLPAADISDYYTDTIEPAKRIYSGSPPWRTVRSSGIKKKSRRRALLNMAKTVCDKMAALTFSEQCEISCDNERYNALIADVLEKNAFGIKFPEWLSRAFALGGGVIKTNIIGGEIKLDYLNADVFFPVKWDNRRITGAVFRSVYTMGGSHYRVYEYTRLENNALVTGYSVWKSYTKADMGARTDIKELFPDTEEEYTVSGVDTPFFVYFKPAIGNNRCFDLPLGVPIFANCYDTLEEIDVVFDSLQREFILGKKRIILPEEMIKTVYDEDGNRTRYFDVDDEIYQAFIGDAGKMGVNDITVPLRVQEHTEALKLLFELLSIQLGLSAGAVSFDRSDGVKTATEVISDERDTMRLIRNQKNILGECIKEMCGSIIAADCCIRGVPTEKYNISVSWQDNVITDDDTRIKRNIDLVSAGLRSALNALIDINGYGEEDAKKELEQIAARQGSGVGSLDGLFGGGEQ